MATDAFPPLTPPSPPAEPATPADSALADARDALERHDWQAAYDAFTRADGVGQLSPTDLEAFAQTAFFAAQPDRELELKERAYKGHLDAGEEIPAAYLAVDIGRHYGFRGKHAIAGAWLRRADRLLGETGATYAHGYRAILRSEAAASRGDLEAALREAEAAVAIGEGVANPDLRAFALTNLGTLKIARGETVDGFAMMEEATIAAVNGELTPFTTGVTCCQMIAACRDLTDYRRATEWIEATERYCERQALSGFPGVCRVHRAEVAALTGAWEQAELELTQATAELEHFHATPPQADGYYAIGEIRRLKGDYAGAETALRDAHARGRTPQPALALIRLAEGNLKAASTAIAGALAEHWDRPSRLRLLPSQVEISVAAGDLATARAALDELTTTIAQYPAPALEAGRQVALGRVLLAEGNAAAAARELRSAIRAWRDVGGPYEVARAQRLLSHALRALDDEADADLELQAALDEFRRLGAEPDVAAVERELRDLEERRTGPTAARRTFMFTDIVGSTSLAEALGDAAWERLLRWHDDRLRELVSAAHGEIVNTTGDGIFVAFDSSVAAVDCAVAIQRALREHRDSTGFALMVRIGLHAADANRRGNDYSGIGVHVAARIAALAGPEEIVASVETLAEAGRPAAEASEVKVKGVTAAIRVARVAWALS